MSSNFRTNKLIRRMESRLVSSNCKQAQEIQVDGSSTFNLNGGDLLEKVAVTATATGTFSIGTTVGGTELFTDSVTDGNSLVVTIDYLQSTDSTIYFTGDAIVKLYIR